MRCVTQKDWKHISLLATKVPSSKKIGLHCLRSAGRCAPLRGALRCARKCAYFSSDFARTSLTRHCPDQFGLLKLQCILDTCKRGSVGQSDGLLIPRSLV